MAQYRKQAAAFNAEHYLCHRCHGRATEIHHTRGRVGKLLFAEQFWLPVCAPCHRWIHDHPNIARVARLLCEKGEWGKQP